MVPAFSLTSPAFRARRHPVRAAGRHVRRATVLCYAPLVLLYAALLLLTARHHNGDALYWAGWWDQSQYLRSARAFAALRFDAAQHWYPLPYTLIEAPFALVTPGAPFVVLDGLCLIGACAGFVAVARAFGFGRPFAVALFGLATLLCPGLGEQWLVPWNTTLSAALIWGALALALPILSGRQADRRRAAGLGVLLATIPLTRPADAVVSVAIVAALLAPMLRGGARWPALAPAAPAAAATFAAYAALHLAIYGPRPSPYMAMSAGIGLKPSWLLWKAYLILVEPRPWYPAGRGLLVACPWLVLGLAGLMLALATDPRRRAAAAMLALAAGGYVACMLSYVDFTPAGLWRYNNVHYFQWVMPLFALFAATLLRDGPRFPCASAAAVILAALPALIHLTPRPAAPGEPARLLRLGPAPAAPPLVTVAPSVVEDRAGLLRNIVEYRQIARDGTVWAIAQRRFFMGGEHWRWRAPSGVRWPGDMVGVPPSPFGTATAVARYRAAWSFGAPCWLPPYPCGGADDPW